MLLVSVCFVCSRMSLALSLPGLFTFTVGVQDNTNVENICVS